MIPAGDTEPAPVKISAIAPDPEMQSQPSVKETVEVKSAGKDDTV